MAIGNSESLTKCQYQAVVALHHHRLRRMLVPSAAVFTPGSSVNLVRHRSSIVSVRTAAISRRGNLVTSETPRDERNGCMTTLTPNGRCSGCRGVLVPALLGGRNVPRSADYVCRQGDGLLVLQGTTPFTVIAIDHSVVGVERSRS
jgi:hypothetical protein